MPLARGAIVKMEFTSGFLYFILKGVILFSPILLFLGAVVVVLGQLSGMIEKWTKFEAFYWSLITALTVGYGDLRPVRKSTRILSIIIALTGIMLTGILVAICVEAATRSFQSYYQ